MFSVPDFHMLFILLALKAMTMKMIDTGTETPTVKGSKVISYRSLEARERRDIWHI
jgi:hypothetical protein